MTSLDKSYISIQKAVDEALSQGRPVVALESTVITHGLPYPENRELALSMEKAINDGGCTPATIAILDGIVHIGLDQTQLDRLAQAGQMHKISVRDIGLALALKLSGGTTVAGTLAIAEQAGIKVFATGGIGGVHRQAPFDVSADLGELRRRRLVVVCAGAKAILDIPATLEVLETYGVPVVGYQTDEFPAFYSLSSGLKVSARADSVAQIASIAKAHRDLGQSSAVLVAVPVPREVALEQCVVESAIQAALAEAQEQGVHGQAVTPFLLQRVSELTHGASLKANLALLLNNARVAAEIAHFIY